MIGYLKGNVIDEKNNVVIIEANGVGYEVTCSQSVYQKLLSEKYGSAYIYTAVREDGIFLYGFISLEEKEMFLKLISVSGVGPKMGITVLSSMNLSTLALCIAKGDVKTLSGVKGLGKKTAERIILELKEKMESVDAETGEIFAPTETLGDNENDAITALATLGFTRGESVTAVKKAKAQGLKTVEQILAFALKNIK
jgi:Holliday junction DNA helicase RuvA